MILLDYQTNNPRWGRSGMKFSDWGSFSLSLGFLSNIQHYKDKGNGTISVHVEENKGAWNSEGRIHYYGRINDLELYLPDLYTHSSAGNNSITCRINSNGYIYSLIYDFGFTPITYSGYTTADVYPPSDNKNVVRNKLQSHLASQLSPEDIQNCLMLFDNGYSMELSVV